MRRYFLVMISCLLLLGLILPANAANSEESVAAFDQLKAKYPQLKFYQEGGRITRIYGKPFGSGGGVDDVAEQFRIKYSQALGVEPNDLSPVSLLFDGRHTQPLMYNSVTGNYKFTLVYYSQFKDGIPVYRADLRLLVRNEPGFPLVMAASALRDLGDFTPPPGVSANSGLAQSAAKSFSSSLTDFTEPRLVIWAGIDDMIVEPAFTMEIVADNGLPATPQYEKWLLLVDAQTGEVLYSENMIIEIDVTGNVSGMASQGSGADICGPEDITPLAYARVYISGGNTVYADANGDFVIPYGGSSPVTVISNIRGEWFRVYNYAGSDAQLSQSVTPPGPANFIHNQSNNSEYNRAEVNAYYHANVVRDFTLTYNPSYPTIPNQYQWPVNVNLNANCNAYYDYESINFFTSGGGCPNTAFSTVVHHEYGHHLVAVGGSGQGAYGEGMGDVMGLLITDDPGTGWGFSGNCNQPLRNADNNMQFPCSGEIHYCGKLISGCVWSTRNELLVTNPASYMDILSNLAINSILMHSGSSITPSITIDYLVLDDDDGDIDNGTPHSDEITSGFGAHNMGLGPPPENDICENAIEACPGTYSGSTAYATNDGSSICGDSDDSPDVWYKYTPLTNGTLTVNACSGTNYDGVLSIHTGCPGTSSNDIACNDDACWGGGPSIVSASVTAGNTYYIRVTGWYGSAGDYAINISGPDCDPGIPPPLTISFPDGLPEYLFPGEPTAVTVQIEDGTESYVPGSGVLHYRYAGGTYLTSALIPIGGNLYEATLPPADCNATPEFYLSAEGDGGATVLNPLDAPNSVHTAIVGTYNILFSDDFSTDLGWTVQNSGGLTDGAWQRAIPAGGGDRGDPPTDYDGSGYCYVTDNADGNSDVDDGYTYLISPSFDLSQGEEIFQYALWYTNNYGADPNNDLFKVWISSNNGANWIHVETFGPVTQSSWTEHSFTVGDHIPPSSQVKVSFEASDLNAGSVVEAGIDAVSIISIECEPISGGTIYGTVTDVDTGDPINGAQVEANDGGGNTGSDLTAGDGGYSISLPVSTYTVSFTHANYYDATIPGVGVTEDGNTLLDVEMEPLPSQEIPTLSEWGMIILALLLISTGTIAVIRRRNPAIEGTR